MREGIKLLTRI